MKTASDKEVKKYMQSLRRVVENAETALSKCPRYESFPDKFQDTEVETAIADIESLCQVVRRFAESIQ